MTPPRKLTAAQRRALQKAPDEWVIFEYPHIRVSTIWSLERRGYLETSHENWRITPAGRAALEDDHA